MSLQQPQALSALLLSAVKAPLNPLYHAGLMTRKRFKAVAESVYEAAVTEFAGGAAVHNLKAALCDGEGVLRGEVTLRLRTLVEEALTLAERG